jgi:hypothetical protein
MKTFNELKLELTKQIDYYYSSGLSPIAEDLEKALETLIYANENNLI